jgi:hypothetical protein
MLFEDLNMKYFCIIFLKVLLIEISCVFCTNISGYCGFPSIPYNAQITPSQAYVDGDTVECKCENKFIDFKQTRVCQKGKWNGNEFLCGNEVIFFIESTLLISY